MTTPLNAVHSVTGFGSTVYIGGVTATAAVVARGDGSSWQTRAFCAKFPTEPTSRVALLVHAVATAPGRAWAGHPAEHRGKNVLFATAWVEWGVAMYEMLPIEQTLLMYIDEGDELDASEPAEEIDDDDDFEGFLELSVSGLVVWLDTPTRHADSSWDDVDDPYWELGDGD